MSMSNPAAERWLLDQWAEENARTLQSMTDSRPSAVCQPLSGGEEAAFGTDTSYFEVAFSLGPDTFLWVALPPEAKKELGQRTLQAAGIDEAGPEEIQSTCAEILQQAHAALAQAIGGRLKRTVSSKSREIERLPADNPTSRLEITYEGSPAISMFVTISPALLASLESFPQVELASGLGAKEESSAITETLSSQMGSSKTFDILLDVSMPVSVSFGRTEMAVKEVLKLTTGSIVELNRGISEPVDVIINDRVIARGEVVVVDGNYGVRIHHIVSRHERFRSTAQAAAGLAKSAAAGRVA
jgi:flagellar motor switch protein FliN/FliY